MKKMVSSVNFEISIWSGGTHASVEPLRPMMGSYISEPQGVTSTRSDLSGDGSDFAEPQAPVEKKSFTGQVFRPPEFLHYFSCDIVFQPRGCGQWKE